MNYSIMKEIDIQKVIPLYINYYNSQEGGIWTAGKTHVNKLTLIFQCVSAFGIYL